MGLGDVAPRCSPDCHRREGSARPPVRQHAAPAGLGTPRSLVVARGYLTDEQWARLEPLLPSGKNPGRPPIRTRRQLIDGIRWRPRTGTPGGMCRSGTGRDRVYDLLGAGSGTAPGSTTSPSSKPGWTRSPRSPGMCASTRLCAGPTSTPPGPAKGGSPEGAAWWHRD
ncbi:transposase [Streptomyces sp. NPDC051644]|uniref:transposase n=1 Tax=Streptomyces sp. NPDC051644 TaxID=3365666 RepID=UPI0037A33126